MMAKDRNRRSNAPGFGSGNGKLKQPKIPQRKRVKLFLPSVPKRSY